MTAATQGKIQQQKRGFRLFFIIWLGDFFSTIGSGLTAFALGVYAFKLTGHATSATMVVFFTFFPAFVLRPFGGVLADRIDRKVLMLLGNLGSAFGTGVIIMLLPQTQHTLFWLYPGIALTSVFVALQNPAYKASLTDFLPKTIYAQASGLMQLSNSAQFLIAPVLAGFLLSIISIKFLLLIDIFTFLLSAAAVAIATFLCKKFPTIQSQEHQDLFSELKDGFKIIYKTKGVFILVILVSVLLFYAGLLQALLAPLVLSFTNSTVLGTLQSVCGVGMLLSSVLISVMKRNKKNSFILSISLALMGLSFSFIGMRPSIWFILLPGFLFFLVIPFANSSIDVLIRQNIDNRQQGRVWALISLITYAGAMIAYAIAGFLADKIFNPLLMPNGALAQTLGHVFGVGPGRGIALIFFISGMLVILVSFFIARSKSIHQLDT